MTYDAAELARLRAEGNKTTRDLCAALEKAQGDTTALGDAAVRAIARTKVSDAALRIANEDRQRYCAERDAARNALEKAQGDLEQMRLSRLEECEGLRLFSRSTIAERDSARALLREAHANVDNWGINGADIRARIAKELAK